MFLSNLIRTGWLVEGPLGFCSDLPVYSRPDTANLVPKALLVTDIIQEHVSQPGFRKFGLCGNSSWGCLVYF